MKNINKLFLALAGSVMMFAACEKWTTPETKNPEDLVQPDRDEAYYERLRDYKSRKDHSVAFGWFGNWTGTGASLENSLRGLPDSVDFVSIWGNFQNLTPAQQADLKYVQEVKGTRAMICFLVFDIGDQLTPPMPAEVEESGMTWKEWRHQFWGWDPNDLDAKIKATEKYANAILDTIRKYGYDGFDLDAEPSYAQPFQTDKELWRDDPAIMETFLTTLAKELGPKSGTNKLLVVDGEPDAFHPKYAEYMDYFIVQAYGSSSFSSLDSRYNTQRYHFYVPVETEEEGGEETVAEGEETAPVEYYHTPEQIANKLIVCENFENWAQAGGVTFRLPDGSTVPSLLGFAKWNPTYNGQTFRKGGVGSYHMEYEYKVSGKTENYPWLREAIRIMNPVIK